MNYEERIQNVSVLGAGGKMGSGIVLLTALEMATVALKEENRSTSYVLNAIDLSNEALKGLMDYLRVQILKAAEKKIVPLRELYRKHEDLIENKDFVDQYVVDVLQLVRPSTRITAAFDSHLIFEAVSENPDLKVRIFSEINRNSKLSPWIFTNTSSVPIAELSSRSGMVGRIAGFHFYNPPAVQKLVELILPPVTFPEVREFAEQYARNLSKTLVYSHDVAGFIGNGHFMREILYAIKKVESMAGKVNFAEAVWILNTISQDFLIRPMGIFQLVDYVGLDVCQYIMSVMNERISEEIHSKTLDLMIEAGIKGGQFADGSQKDGFLKYEKGKITAVFDLMEKTYGKVEEISRKTNALMGSLPTGHIPWKVMIGKPFRETDLKTYFTEMKSMKSAGASLAIEYAEKSKEIGQILVREGVAASEKDVNTVLLTGFYHAYGPIHDYLT